ncbi:MAG: hypothetical protein PHR16_06390 [Methylovulum sp.]|nr:hypothetical protein [Methylovulum sp.]
MNHEMRQRRRKVAWACFQPFLNEQQLMESVQILERGYQTDSVSNLIAYISKICTEFGIGGEIRKSLYSRFHQMMFENTDSLVDPLALAQGNKQSTLSKKAVEPSPAPAAAPAPQPPLPEETAALPLPVLIFSYFMQQIIAGLADDVDFFPIMLEHVKGDSQQNKQSFDLIMQWADSPDKFDWATALNEKMLADLVHVVYTTLCDILGPINADNAFHRAVAYCEQKPEARLFPPSRFF